MFTPLVSLQGRTSWFTKPRAELKREMAKGVNKK